MRKPQTNFSKAILAFVLLSFVVLMGCGNAPTTSQNANSSSGDSRSDDSPPAPSDNGEKLLELVRLPVMPDEVVWMEDLSANPKKITAVLQFEKEELPKFAAIIEKNKLADLAEVELETWFPQELTAKAQLSGEGVLKGTAYAANEFFNIPYGNGRITRIQGTDFFVLELTSD